MNLSNNENLILRMLYSQHYKSNEIPPAIFTSQVKESLLSLGLIYLAVDNLYYLTPQAIKVVEENSFIVKYPLATETGIVGSYTKVLEQMSKEAAYALGLTIVNTDFHKKWGKSVNLNLYEKLKESHLFYRSVSNHPTKVISLFEQDVREAELQYEAIVNHEFLKIDEQVAIYPSFKVYDNQLKDSLLVLEYLPTNKIVVKDSKGDIVSIDLDVYSYVRLNTEHKTSIIKSYYNQKSRKNDSSKEA